jgi:hypothetical protein
MVTRHVAAASCDEINRPLSPIGMRGYDREQLTEHLFAEFSDFVAESSELRMRTTTTSSGTMTPVSAQRTSGHAPVMCASEEPSNRGRRRFS